MNINIKLSDKIKNRTLFAKDVAKMFNGEDLVDFPYMPNDNDDSFWTIDMGNDWKIGFNDEDASIFYIMYRYGHHEIENMNSKQRIFVSSLAKKYDGVILN